MIPVIDDITARKHGGNENSIEANKAVEKEKDRRMVFNIVLKRDDEGATLDEISQLTGRPANAISGRLTELKNDNRIFRRGDKRPTRSGVMASVWRAV